MLPHRQSRFDTSHLHKIGSYTLQELNKLVNRTVYNDSPVLVEYTVTPYCKSFGDIILEMIKWGKEHRELITGRKQSY